jgi:hypothetical protein
MSRLPRVFMYMRARNGVSFHNTFEVRLATRLPVIATHVHTAKIRQSGCHRLADKFLVPGDLRPLSMFKVLSR